MAHITIDDVIDIGTGGYHNATSIEIAEDPDFLLLIDATYKDTVHVKKWYSQLPKRDGTGYHADLSKLYVRVKVFVDDNESPWFVLDVADQNKQDVIITEEGKEDIHTTSDAIGMV